MPEAARPIGIVGAGPVGLLTALGLRHYGVPFVLFEEDARLSLDTKAGTVLTRSLELMDRFGVLRDVLNNALKVDEIGELDRASGVRTLSVRTGDLIEDTRFPFVINIPQHHLEPVLKAALDTRAPGAAHLQHRLVAFEQRDDHVLLRLDGPAGPTSVEVSYLLACDGGRSTVREQLGVNTEGFTLAERYMLVDLEVDLDGANRRDYPYLSYFADPVEWMILVRQPHCWRFLYPLPPGAEQPGEAELVAKAVHFIGQVDQIRVVGTNVYSVHHRVAERWRDGRVFLLGDAAHLITPMWALGLNTGLLDVSNLSWRLAWAQRGWADDLILDGYEGEQSPLARQGSGEMAEAARAYMDGRRHDRVAMTDGGWGNAFTRALLGVRLDVDNTGDHSMVKTGSTPSPVLVGDRCPDLPLHSAAGIVHLHDLVRDSFVALHFTDIRRNPALGADVPGLQRYLVSRWDAPFTVEARPRCLFDPADRVRRRFGFDADCVALVRPDGHLAAVLPAAADADEADDEADTDTVDLVLETYRRITRRSTRKEPV